MHKILSFYLIVCLGFSCKPKASDNNILTVSAESDLLIDEKLLEPNSFETINFPSKDNLEITADIYKIKDVPISILLCHQAGYSRGEYKDTALILNELGYSVMAIDQRSGKSANAIANETAKRAKDKNLPTHFLDARQDIEAAIDYIYKVNSSKPILLVGSSYSASLSLLIGVSNQKVKAVAAFSPGEYFKGVNIQGLIKDYNKPVFVTASNNETAKLSELVSEINSKVLTHYKPQEKGIHGSRALWNSTEGVNGYWDAFKLFLKKF